MEVTGGKEQTTPKLPRGYGVEQSSVKGWWSSRGAEEVASYMESCEETGEEEDEAHKGEGG